MARERPAFQAKFAGKCVKCGVYFSKGDRIHWKKGAGGWHEDCEAARAGAMRKREEGALRDRRMAREAIRRKREREKGEKSCSR